MEAKQQYCLKWNNHKSNISGVFDRLRNHQRFVDVTLASADHQSIKCHRLLFSSARARRPRRRVADVRVGVGLYLSGPAGLAGGAASLRPDKYLQRAKATQRSRRCHAGGPTTRLQTAGRPRRCAARRAGRGLPRSAARPRTPAISRRSSQRLAEQRAGCRWARCRARPVRVKVSPKETRCSSVARASQRAS